MTIGEIHAELLNDDAQKKNARYMSDVQRYRSGFYRYVLNVY